MRNIPRLPESASVTASFFENPNEKSILPRMLQPADKIPVKTEYAFTGGESRGILLRYPAHFFSLWQEGMMNAA